MRQHDRSAIIVTRPLLAQIYLPKGNLPPDYFPLCMVSQSATTGLISFNGTRTDATDSVKRGSPGIRAALDSASIEILRVHAHDVQVDYRTELLSSCRLMSLYYDDCMMFGHARRLIYFPMFSHIKNTEICRKITNITYIYI